MMALPTLTPLTLQSSFTETQKYKIDPLTGDGTWKLAAPIEAVPDLSNPYPTIDQANLALFQAAKKLKTNHPSVFDAHIKTKPDFMKIAEKASQLKEAITYLKEEHHSLDSLNSMHLEVIQKCFERIMDPEETNDFITTLIETAREHLLSLGASYFSIPEHTADLTKLTTVLVDPIVITILHEIQNSSPEYKNLFEFYDPSEDDGSRNFASLLRDSDGFSDILEIAFEAKPKTSHTSPLSILLQLLSDQDSYSIVQNIFRSLAEKANDRNEYLKFILELETIIAFSNRATYHAKILKESPNGFWQHEGTPFNFSNIEDLFMEFRSEIEQNGIRSFYEDFRVGQEDRVKNYASWAHHNPPLAFSTNQGTAKVDFSIVGEDCFIMGATLTTPDGKKDPVIFIKRTFPNEDPLSLRSRSNHIFILKEGNSRVITEHFYDFDDFPNDLPAQANFMMEKLIFDQVRFTHFLADSRGTLPAEDEVIKNLLPLSDQEIEFFDPGQYVGYRKDDNLYLEHTEDQELLERVQMSDFFFTKEGQAFKLEITDFENGTSFQVIAFYNQSTKSFKLIFSDTPENSRIFPISSYPGLAEPYQSVVEACSRLLEFMKFLPFEDISHIVS